jgi:hypothetical protein
MLRTTWKLQSAFLIVLIVSSLGGVAAAANDRPRVTLPEARKVVLLWDYRRPDLPRSREEPQVSLLADGSLTVSDPHGSGKTLTIKLSAEEVQELLAFIIHDQGFFQIDSAKVQASIRAAQLQDGLVPGSGATGATLLRVQGDGREHEVRFSDLRSHADCTRETKRLAAIEQRLGRLVHWAYAGGKTGLDAALKRANERLQKEFPDAPQLTAADLQSAVQKVNGSAHVILERRGVARDKNPFSFIYASLDWAGAAEEPHVTVKANLADTPPSQDKKKPVARDLPVSLPVPVGSDKAVKYDYPIVYVRAPHYADNVRNRWPNTHTPLVAPPGSELMLLHPDGREEVLVAVNEKEAITDPYVSFDGTWVYYVKFHDQTLRDDLARTSRSGSDIYKIHVPTRRIVQLTHQEYTPNTGSADGSQTKRPAVFNLGPCPVPGGKVAFTSDRNGFRSVRAGQPVAQQLFIMDDDGSNVENIGHINLGSAHHPTILKDGRLIFSTTETQGLRGGYFGWGIWSVHPDGTSWGPIVSAFSSNVFHFQAQLADGRIVVEFYYPGTTTKGFGTFFTLPTQPADGYTAFSSARGESLEGVVRQPFTPYGMKLLTRFSDGADVPPNRGWGQFTHPSGAPDNHLLTVWGGASGEHRNNAKQPPFDSGIYLIKSGQALEEPGQLVLIKNDPKYHEMMPRALVPYERIYGVPEPTRLAFYRNDGKSCPHLPEGTPFGLVGTSSLYKRESAPLGVVARGSVTATYSGGKDLFQGMGRIIGNAGGETPNWQTQGADAGLYSNDDIHAIRILALEPVNAGVKPRMAAHGSTGGRSLSPNERLRILGEFPVRHFGTNSKQPLDPDGNPDTSFLAKIPADVAWTFQTLDKNGMVLNMAQTWHQLRPGEIRNNCGGCHAHSQKPTEFKNTFAARADYVPFDLTERTPFLTTKKHDESGKQWDVGNETGLRFAKGVKNVEFYRDVKPILDRSCAACHTLKAEKPAGNLVLDDDQLMVGLNDNGKVPGTYYRLALDQGHVGYQQPQKFGNKSPTGYWSSPIQASRYIRKFQSRRSLLVWKVFGKRLDGWTNDDFPSETIPGDKKSLAWKGKPLEPTRENLANSDLDYLGSAMPPPEAVAGTYVGPDGRKIKVAPLSDEDRLTLVRWIDLGCPIDLTFDPDHPEKRGTGGWMVDDQRPTVALTYPRAGANADLSRILIGMFDYDTGLDMKSFEVVADFAVDGVPAGTNLAEKFKVLPGSRWELALAKPIASLPSGKLTVSIRDRQGNVTRVERTFSVGNR